MKESTSEFLLRLAREKMAYAKGPLIAEKYRADALEQAELQLREVEDRPRRMEEAKRLAAEVRAGTPEGFEALRLLLSRNIVRKDYPVVCETEGKAIFLAGQLQQWAQDHDLSANAKRDFRTVKIWFSVRPAVGPDAAAGEVRARTPIPPEVRAAVWQRDNGTCQKCGVTDAESMTKSGEHLHYDHIIPFSRNGADTAANLQLLCESCNLSKGASLTVTCSGTLSPGSSSWVLALRIDRDLLTRPMFASAPR